MASLLHMLDCATATLRSLFSAVPPLPAEWKYVVMLLITFLKNVSNPPHPQTPPPPCLWINKPRCKFKSSSRMTTRNNRTRSSPTTRKTRRRRKRILAHNAATQYINNKQNLIWQTATLTMLLSIFSYLHGCLYAPDTTTHQFLYIPLDNLPSKMKLPNLIWHGLQPEVAISPTTYSMCPYKSKRLVRWLNSKKMKSCRRRLRIQCNSATLHKRWDNEWAQIKTYGQIVRNSDDVSRATHELALQRNHSLICKGAFALRKTLRKTVATTPDDCTLRELTISRILLSNNNHDLDKYLTELHHDHTYSLFDSTPADSPAAVCNSDICKKELQKLLLLNSTSTSLDATIKRLAETVDDKPVEISKAEQERINNRKTSLELQKLQLLTSNHNNVINAIDQIKADHDCVHLSTSQVFLNTDQDSVRTYLHPTCSRAAPRYSRLWYVVLAVVVVSILFLWSPGAVALGTAVSCCIAGDGHNRPIRLITLSDKAKSNLANRTADKPHNCVDASHFIRVEGLTSQYVAMGLSTIPNADYGLFAKKDIKGDTNIKIAQYKMKVKDQFLPNSHYYAQIGSIAVDAHDFYSCFPRFLNDPLDAEKDNCQFAVIGNQIWIVPFKDKDITAFDELFISYGRDWWYMFWNEWSYEMRLKIKERYPLTKLEINNKLYLDITPKFITSDSPLPVAPPKINSTAKPILGGLSSVSHKHDSNDYINTNNKSTLLRIKPATLIEPKGCDKFKQTLLHFPPMTTNAVPENAITIHHPSIPTPHS